MLNFKRCGRATPFTAPSTTSENSSAAGSLLTANCGRASALGRLPLTLAKACGDAVGGPAQNFLRGVHWCTASLLPSQDTASWRRRTRQGLPIRTPALQRA